MFQTFTETASPDTGPARLAALQEALRGRDLTGFLVPRADAHQGEYVAPCDDRLAWLTGFTGSAGWAVALSDDGEEALAAGELVAGDGVLISRWSLESGDDLGSVATDGADIRSIAFGPDDRTAVTGDEDGLVRVWELESGQEIARMVGHEDTVHGVAVTDDGTRVLSSAFDGSVRTWDVASLFDAENESGAGEQAAATQ